MARPALGGRASRGRLSAGKEMWLSRLHGRCLCLGSTRRLMSRCRPECHRVLSRSPTEGKVMPKPLTGIRVLELSKGLAGPLCAHALGDLRSDIIKVETGAQSC